MWMPAADTCPNGASVYDAATGVLKTPVCHFSDFAVMFGASARTGSAWIGLSARVDLTTRAASSPASSSSSSNTGLAVGVAVGVVAVCILAFIIGRCRKNREAERSALLPARPDAGAAHAFSVPAAPSTLR
jgi:hypothetical protein